MKLSQLFVVTAVLMSFNEVFAQSDVQAADHRCANYYAAQADARVVLAKGLLQDLLALGPKPVDFVQASAWEKEVSRLQYLINTASAENSKLTARSILCVFGEY